MMLMRTKVALRLAVAAVVAASVCQASSIQVIFAPSSTTPRYTVGFVDADAGKVGQVGPITLPDSNCTPGWTLGHGTRGQTSTAFFVNMTWFVLGQELCGTTIMRTSLFGMFGYSESADPAVISRANRMLAQSGGIAIESAAASTTSASKSDVQHTAAGRLMFYGDFAAYSTSSMENWNIAWDWTCNILVICPQNVKGKTTFHTLQVSEYDSQVRPQPALLSYMTGCTDCWVKVAGSSALQQQPQTTPSRTAEENCGDQCVLYVTEEYRDSNGVLGALPQRLIGRTFRTGKVVSNISNSMNVKTWTSGSPYAMMSSKPSDGAVWSSTAPFFGLGVCCSADVQCAAECAGHSGSLALISYTGLAAAVKVLAVLPLRSTDDAAVDTFALGLVIDPVQPWGPPGGEISARVFVKKTILTYALAPHGDGYIAHLNGTSAPMKSTPVAWTLQRDM